MTVSSLNSRSFGSVERDRKLRDDLLRDAPIGDDVVEIRHQNGFGEHREIAGPHVFTSSPRSRMILA